MKKKICLIVSCAMVVASGAVADFALSWANQDYFVNLDTGVNLADGASIQLIWTATIGDRAVSKAGIGGSVADGEYLIADWTTSEIPGIVSDAGTWLYPSVAVITDAMVASSGIGVNTGYVFTRIFQDSTIDAGDIYWDSAYLAASKVYNDLDTDTIEQANTITGGSVMTEFGTTVIPEPATIGLMGIAGLGMFMARKKVRR